MKQLTCEMCGSTELVKQDGVFVCHTCGTKYSVEEAKKMMVEGTVDVSGSTVSIDNSKEIENLRILARRAKDSNNSKDAEKYFSQILKLTPNDWEAVFYTLYYQSMNIKIGEIGSTAGTLKSSLTPIFESVACIETVEEKNFAISEIVIKIVSLCENYRYNSLKHCTESFERMIDTNSNLAFEYVEDHVEVVKEILAIMLYLNDELEKYSNNDEYFDTTKKCILLNNKVFFDIFVNTPTFVTEDEKTKWTFLLMGLYNKITPYDECFLWPEPTFEGYPSGLVNICKNNVKDSGYLRVRASMNEDAQKKILEAKRKEKEERFAKYWETRMDEKNALEKEKADILNEIDSLNSQLDGIIEKNSSKVNSLNAQLKERTPLEIECDIQEQIIADLEQKREKCGIFKAKEKKAIQERIDNEEKPKLNTLKQQARSERTEHERKINAELKSIKSEGSELREKIGVLWQKCDDITLELTKDR